MTRVDVLNQKGKVVDHVKLDEQVFDGKINADLMHQAIVTHLANSRQGTASTKARGQVHGGGRKPWRQKGTGRARVGSIRSPLWKGGGVVFGAKPRDYTKKFPKRMKVLALKSALNTQLKENALMVIDEVTLSAPKTKEFFKMTQDLKVNEDKIRLVMETLDSTVKRASRNLENVMLEKAENLTTYTVLNCKKIIFTKESLHRVEEKIKKWLK